MVNHNGGYVMLDELGPPWPKHPCFAEKFGKPTPKQLLEGLIGEAGTPNPALTTQKSINAALEQFRKDNLIAVRERRRATKNGNRANGGRKKGVRSG
jgi:hypothetical protein